jgi:hypothetical protein
VVEAAESAPGDDLGVTNGRVCRGRPGTSRSIETTNSMENAILVTVIGTSGRPRRASRALSPPRGQSFERCATSVEARTSGERSRPGAHPRSPTQPRGRDPVLSPWGVAKTLHLSFVASNSCAQSYKHEAPWAGIRDAHGLGVRRRAIILSSVDQQEDHRDVQSGDGPDNARWRNLHRTARADPCAGVVTYTDGTSTFAPASVLDLSLQYTATITTQAADLQGKALADNYVWTFTTGACSLEPVGLLSAANFAVLAGSTLTNTGPTSVTGDLGVSPGTAVTDFPPGNLIGTQHAGDPTAGQGIADLTTAYNDAAGRTLCAVSKSGNLGGQTLAPGLYKSTSSLEVTSGDPTLDAQGDEDAVFIFQMASTLTTTSGRQVILSGGAKATNVFWQVGSSATLGTTSAFQGTIMADQAITVGTGATLTGRALARIAAVTLDGNTIVKPAP